MEVKPGYKQTEVGVIPDDWNVSKISEICSMKSGEGITSTHIDQFSKYPCYGGNGLRGYTTRFTHDGTFALVGRQGALCGNVLSVDGKFFASEHAIVVRASEETDIRWLTFVLARMHLNQYSESSAQPGLSVAKILTLELVRPPTKAEQKAIAQALSDADALIESLEQLIAKKRNIKQGAMQELLTGKRRLPGFDGEWKVKRIGEVLSIVHGKSQHAVADPNGIYPVLATGGQIGNANRFLYDKPSVLIGRKGTIDRPQFMDKPFWTVDTLFYSVIREPNNAKFLFYRFCLIEWKRYNEASGVPSLNAKTVERIEMKIPQEDEQTAIVAVLSDMDAEIAALEERLAKVRQIKQGMMQELLTGRIRLI